MRTFLLLTSFLAVLFPHGAVAASLNKCIDARGQVTYSNLPCKNARETRKVEIDPAPLPDPVRPAPAVQIAKPVAPTAPESKTPERKQEPTSIKLETQRSSEKPAARPSTGKCNTLSDKLGRVFDKMDAARRKGYTQEQMDDWNQQVKDLERQKQQAGCF